MALIGDLVAKLGFDITGWQAGVGKAMSQAEGLGAKFDSAFKNTGSALDAMGKKLTAISGTMSSFGSAMSMSISAPLAALGTLAVATSDKMATAKIGFETMLGSAQKADAFIRELADFAKRTPFDFPGLQSAAQRMLALGFASKEIIPILTAVGNAVGQLGGGQEKIDRIVLAFGQMQAKGRVMTQEMNQLTESGVKAWQYLADAVGKAQGKLVTVGDVMKMVEGRMLDGAAAVRIISLSMEKDFAGGMEKASKLITGQLSNLRDAIVGPGGPLDQIGKAITPMVMGWIQSLQGLIPVVNGLIGQFTSLSPATQQFAVQFAAIAVAIGPVTFGLSKLALVFGPLLSGLGSVAGAVPGLVAAVKNISFALGSGLVGALTTGEMALLAFGAAVTVAATALTVWKLEAWAREQSEAMGDFVVAMTGPISIIPKLGDKFRELKAELQNWGSFLGAIKKDVENFINAFVQGFLAIDKAVNGPISSFKRVVAGIREIFPELEKLISLYRALVAAKEIWDKMTTIPKPPPPPTALEANRIMGAAPGGGGAPGIESGMAEFERMAASGKALTAAANLKVLQEQIDKLIRPSTTGSLPTWQKQINDGWKEWDTAIEGLRGKVRGLLEAFEETDIPREFLGPLADQLEQLGEQDLRKLQESLKQLMSQEEQIADGWSDWARETENLRGKIRGLADEFKALEIPEEFAGSLESLTTLSEDGLRELEPVLNRLIEQQKAINDGWADWAAADAKIEASIQSLQAALEEFGVTMERTAGETLEGFKVRVEGELVAQKQIAEGWKELGEFEAREAANISEVYRRFAQDMSSTFDRLGNDIARNITSLKGMGDAFKDWALSIKDAILNLVINQALKPLKDYIEDVVTPAIANFVNNTLGFKLPSLPGGKKPGVPGGLPGVDEGGNAIPGVGGAAGGMGGLLGAMDVVSGVVSAVAAVWDVTIQRRIEKDIGRIEVTTRGLLAEALNFRADAWDRFTKTAVQLDSLFSFTWVKLDEIITSIRNWAGPAAGGTGSTGSTTPGTPNDFAGGTGQGPRTRDVPEHLPYPDSDRPPVQVAIPGGGSLSTSNVPWGSPFAIPQEWEESVQGLAATVNQLSSAVTAAWIRIDNVLVRGMIPAAAIQAPSGGHDGGVGSSTAYYQAYYRALEESINGPRQRGTQGSPFGGGQGVALPPGVIPVGNTINVYIQGGTYADDASMDRLAMEIAERTDRRLNVLRLGR